MFDLNPSPVRVKHGVYHLGVYTSERVPLGAGLEGPGHEDWRIAQIKEEMRLLIQSLGGSLKHEFHWSHPYIDNGGQWHIDSTGATFGILSRFGANSMVIMALHDSMGTEFKGPKGKIFHALPWNLYLVKWNILHRKPHYLGNRIFLRFYTSFSRFEGRCEINRSRDINQWNF